MHASLASYAAAAMPTLDLRPEMAHAHQPAMSPSHHAWDGNGAAVAPTPMPKRLDGKVAIVTGGARGIGEAIVRLFVKHGARVVIADIDDDAGEALASALGQQVSFVRCDVSVEEDVKRAVDCALSRHGGRLDVYCNNAGVLGRQTRAAKSILSFDAGEFDRVLRVNALGAALGMKHAALAMAPRRAGSIVSVASVAGVLGGLGPHAYTASKHAIVGLTKNASCELGAHGIRVNCVSPFGVATPMLINAWRQGHDEAGAQATEHVSSQEFVLDKYIDDLYEKRGSTRENALCALVDALESFVLLGLVENKYVTLLSQFTNSIKKGSAKEVCVACRAIGLLAITLGAGSSSHEIMDESHPQLLRILQTWPDSPKMISALDCLAVVTFVGANDLAETQLSLKAIWDVIHPKSGSKVGIVRKPNPPLLAAAVSAWAFLLTTVGSSRRNSDSWKEPITFLSSLLEAEDRAVRIAAGEALALCFELKLLDVFSSEEADVDSDTRDISGFKNQVFLNMQGLKAKISGLVHNLSMEAGGRGADKKNLNDQRDLFQRISDFIKSGECPEESLRISGKNGILRVASWRESIQLNYLRRFLGRGFLKHAQDNNLLHDIFDIKIDRVKNMSTTEKKIFRSEEEKGRALKLNKERRLAQERKQNMFNEQYG